MHLHHPRLIITRFVEYVKPNHPSHEKTKGSMWLETKHLRQVQVPKNVTEQACLYRRSPSRFGDRTGGRTEAEQAAGAYRGQTDRCRRGLALRATRSAGVYSCLRAERFYFQGCDAAGLYNEANSVHSSVGRMINAVGGDDSGAGEGNAGRGFVEQGDGLGGQMARQGVGRPDADRQAGSIHKEATYGDVSAPTGRRGPAAPAWPAREPRHRPAGGRSSCPAARPSRCRPRRCRRG